MQYVCMPSSPCCIMAGGWFAQGETTQLQVDRLVVGSVVQTDLSAGFVGMGAGGYYGVQYDNFYMEG